jgi:hypothetical protein
MAWIESHTVIIRHRKLIGLSSDLKIRRAYAMGHLHSLWHSAIEQQEDGNLSTWSDAMIAESADYPGDPKRLVHSLKINNWLERDRRLHDWWDYAGPFLRSKYKRSPEKWERVRSLYVTVTSPPNRTVPNLTNLTNLTNHENAGDGFAEHGKNAMAEAAILSKPWHLRGDYQGVRIGDLPAGYCEYALKTFTKLTPEERLGCEIVINRKRTECAK